MTMIARLFAAVLVFGLGLAQPSHAQDRLKDLDSRFEEQLKKFDPVAVAAARSYSKSFNTQAQLDQMSQAMTPGFTQQLKAKNSSMNEADIAAFLAEFFKVALVDSAPVIEKWTILNMLEVLTTEEIVAADKFYSSPIGRSMMAKLPQLMAKMPEMMGILEKYAIPAGIAAATAKLKAMGKDVKI